MGTLSSVLGIANQAQGLKNAQLSNEQGQQALQQSQINLQERQGIQGVMANIKQYQDPQGNVDFNKLMPDIMKVAPTTGPAAIQNMFQAQTSATNAKVAVGNLDAQSRNTVAQTLYALKGQPKEVVQSTLQGLETAYPNVTPAVQFMSQYILPPFKSGAPQADLDTAMDRAGRFVESAPIQQNMQTPGGIPVSNGQQTSVVSTKPGTTVPTGTAIPGTAVQQQLPPTTPTMVGGQPQYLGPQAAATPGAAAPVAAGPAIGQAEGITGPIAANNTHYATVVQDASAAPNRIAALENIKQEIDPAIMGGSHGGELIRNVLANMSGIFGFANSTTTASDVMAKNLAQLALQGGATDAAKTFASMGSPNQHVTADAAKEAVAQLEGVEHKKQSAGQFFAGVPTNSPEYSNRMQMWNRYADPRAFQYAALPPPERAKMKATMQKAGTWKALNDNMAHLAAMGVQP